MTIKNAMSEPYIIFNLKNILESNGGVVKVRFKDAEKQRWFEDATKHKADVTVIAKEDDIFFEPYNTEDDL